MTYVATEEESHNFDVDEKIRLIKKDIGKLLQELFSSPDRVRIPFPHNCNHVAHHIFMSPNDDALDMESYLLEIFHEGAYLRVDPIVVHGGYIHTELKRKVTLSDVTHLCAAPALLLNWKIPFDSSVKEKEIERRRKIGKKIALLKQEIKAWNSLR